MKRFYNSRVRSADGLQTANESFYEALEALDLEAMDRVWLHEDWVRCIHPGWETIVGWPLVRRSWEQIFLNTGWMRVATTDVETRDLGELGLVTCAENISIRSQGEIGLAVAMATNLFKRTPDGWRLVLHQASPSPVQVAAPAGGGLM
jgi:ketosteroid isomerase-like protein